MGARAYMSPRLMQSLPDHLSFGYIGRPERASPGEGYPAAHTTEQTRILRTALDLMRPVTLYPAWLGAIVTISPLYQSAALMRGFSLGQFQWIMLFRAAYLLAIALVCLSIASRRFRKILAP